MVLTPVSCSRGRLITERHGSFLPDPVVSTIHGFPRITMEDKTLAKLQVRTKTWIENDRGELLFGKGKTEILELIEEVGSIAKAAEQLGMSYKKAWTHIKILQENIADELVIAKKGGGGRGGTTLSPNARELVGRYRQLQEEIEAFANRRFHELFGPDGLNVLPQPPPDK